MSDTMIMIVFWLVLGILSIAADSETQIEQLREEIKRIKK